MSRQDPNPEERRRIVDDVMKSLNKTPTLPDDWAHARDVAKTIIHKIRTQAFAIIAADPATYDRNKMSQFLTDQLSSEFTTVEKDIMVKLVTIAFHHEILNDVENQIHDKGPL